MRLRLERLRRDEMGIGLVLVIAFAGIVMTLLLVGAALANNALSSSGQHVRFEAAMGAAENGIDATLARTQHVYQTVGTDEYVTPTTPSAYVSAPECNTSSIAWPFIPTQPTEAQEREWARSKLLALAGTAGCLRSSPSGQYVTLKPHGRQVVYSMGWAPTFATAKAKARLLKAEYLFAPYKPSHAILTSGDVEIGSSTQVTSAPPNDPGLASVHSNGIVKVSSGNPIVWGPVTSAGVSSAQSNRFYGNSAAGGAVTQTAGQTVPAVSARQVWGLNHAGSFPGGWYDLCADGKVRNPDEAAPCVGTVLGDYSAGGLNQGTSFRGGWSYDGSTTPHRWLAGKSISSGVYYADGADVMPDTGAGNTSIDNATIIAAASRTMCDKVAGNISWDHNDITAPAVPNLFMLADQDLKTSANFHAGGATNGTVVSGFFIAGDQVELLTSANGAYGAVVAADQCDPADGISMVDSNLVKNPAIYYDPNQSAPFVDIVNTTLWLEYPAAG